jgi:hypothetical protein
MSIKTVFHNLAILLIGAVFIFFISCKSDNYQIKPIPAPVTNPGCAHYTNGYSLPQTQSLQQLSEYLSSEHFDYDLDGWFFFGSLVDNANTDDPGVFFIAVQRIEESSNGFRTPMIPAIVGFNSRSLGKYEFRGFFTIDISSLMTVTSNHWTVKLISPFQSGPLITMSTVSGTMGAPDAVYSLTADIPDFNGIRLKANVRLRDRFGTVNQGDGTASFFAQFLTNSQREQIMHSSERTVSNYLRTTADPMSCQGSYYYSLPLLDVDQFTITRNDSVLSSGSKGLMWMDYVVQSYDQRAADVFSKASWSFFAIQFPDINTALMVIEINSATGSLPIAKLFSTDGDMTLNYAHNAKYTWAINNINIEAVPGTTWTSPRSYLNYAMQHHIQLMSADFPADLTLTMVRDDQEIYVDKNTIKYEGLATVSGMLGSMAVTGQAFVEIQPVGHLK